jgi:hypothetical protein
VTRAEKAAALEAFVASLVGAVPTAPPPAPQAPLRYAPRVDGVAEVMKMLKQLDNQ